MPSLKNRLAAKRRKLRKRGLSVIHRIEVAISINSMDDSSQYAGPQGPPIVAAKTANFFAVGRDLDECISKVHNHTTAYLESVAPAIGTKEPSRLVAVPSASEPNPDSSN